MHQIDGWNTINASDRLVCLAFFTFGRLGVPFFLFLSGYLLLSKHQCQNISDIKIFIKKKWLPLLICWYIWILLYNLLLVIYGWGDVSLKAIKHELLLKSFPPIPHLWFMPMIVKAYLLIPLFSFLICRFGKIAFLILLAASFLSSFKYEFGCYTTYILVGYFWYLYKDRVNKLICLAFLASAIALFCYIVQVQFVDFMNGTVHKVWYTEHSIMLCTFLAFPCFKYFDEYKKSYIEEISMSSFAIYLMHFACLFLVADHIKSLNLPVEIKCIGLFVSIFAMSYGMFKLASYNKYIAKYAFLSKPYN